MKRSRITLPMVLVVLFSTWNDAGAIGGRGGGGGGRGGGGGGGGGGMSRGGGAGGRGGGGGGAQMQSRPASRPAGGQGSSPNLGGGHAASRPSQSRPSASRPSVSQLPSPKPSSPSGGLKPSHPGGSGIAPTRPGGGSPIANNRPGGNTLPGGGRPGGDGPGLAGGSGTRPSVPDLGGSRPGTSRPGGGQGPIAGGERPAPGDVGDFLGMTKPVGPGGGPEFGNRPGAGGAGRPGNRPGDGSRPGNRPGDGRPNIGNNIGNDVNLNINNRPSWNNLDNDRFNNINNKWSNNIINNGNRGNWYHNHRDRYDHWHGWGDNVRHNWGQYHHHGDWFHGNWWNNHPHGWCGWHYGYYNRPWNYWWTVPTVAALTSWFTWQAPAQVWTQPVYYDYGQGGNVYYENNTVYVDGQELCSADEYAQSAATLATVPPPDNEEQAAELEWMPLGTFAVSSNADEAEPSRVIQLAVSKTGIISGTLYNIQTDQAQTVQGQVDKETQRVAFRIGDSENIVVETGLYNLTQDEAPILVHYGTEQVENWLLVRLPEPAEETQAATP